jgi:hypothetical protein
MQLSETITIYLAIGAPFGVNFFLRQLSLKRLDLARSLMRAAGACLLWPFVAVATFIAGHSTVATPVSEATAESSLDGRASEERAAAEQRLFAALESVHQMAATVCGPGEDLEQNIRAVREGIEKYVGLTTALAATELDAEPSGRELELCRIAGRVGDDLLLAGRCIHRRSFARLSAHQARARAELIDALCAVRELNSAGAHVSLAELKAARHLSVAVLKFYGHAINLLSLLEDERAAMSAARLLDSECARLRKLEALILDFEEAFKADGTYARQTHADRQALA